MKKLFFLLPVILTTIFAESLINENTSWEDLKKMGLLEITENGNSISIYHPKDVISYTRHIFDENYITQLKQSYHGLGDIAHLEKLLENQNYIEILNHIWTEKDINKRVQWLKDKALENHPILMLELAYAYILQSPTLDTLMRWAMPWLSVARTRILMDIECSSDKSVEAAAFIDQSYEGLINQHLLKNYSLEDLKAYIAKNETLHLYFFNMYELAEIVLEPFVEQPSNEPSPEWVFFHGLGSFIGDENTIPKSEWDVLRQKSAFQRLESIHMQKETFKNNYDEWLKYAKSFFTI